MSTAAATDIAALVGEMEAPACESVGHESQEPHDSGPATHYARLHCNECGIDIVKSYCSTFSALVMAGLGNAQCYSCNAIHYLPEHITILGPVNK